MTRAIASVSEAGLSGMAKVISFTLPHRSALRARSVLPTTMVTLLFLIPYYQPQSLLQVITAHFENKPGKYQYFE